jgi:hypothetical protein
VEELAFDQGPVTQHSWVINLNKEDKSFLQLQRNFNEKVFY